MSHHHSGEEKRCLPSKSPNGSFTNQVQRSSNDSPLRNPYTEGSTLSLIVEHGCNILTSSTVKATVIKLIQPVSMSPVVEVMLQMKSGLETKAILKLYDRRFATSLRKQSRAQPCTPKTEELYKQYVLQGRAEKLFEELDKPSDDEGDGDGDGKVDDTDSDDEEEHNPNLKTGQMEGCLHHESGFAYACELQAYAALRDLQGHMIPTFLASVRLTSADTDIPQHLLKYFDIKGILLEYIEGFDLFDLETKVPQPQWQAICEDAIRIVNLVGDRGIINHDVRPGNFLVTSNSGGKYQVFQIDFGHADYRDGLSWEVWRENKASLDEEGAVGMVMERLLKGGFKYRRSWKFHLDDEGNVI